MTTVIDHAIAIPTRPAAVWQVVSDITNLPKWHPDSQRVQHLTTIKSGRGTRWRNTTRSNKEQVVEITAWYDGLGYEYRIVDGSDYPKNRGRIRLQEAPEGTIVQWTFSYETRGFVSNLRNNLSMKGRADKEIVQGLRNLYTIIKESRQDEVLDPEQSKAYLKEAPNVEERASYQPRYPIKGATQEIAVVDTSEDARYKPPVEVEKPIQPVSAAAKIVEPPVADDDTRPNPVVQQAEKVPPAAPLKEPDFLKTMPDPEPVKPAASVQESPVEKTVSESPAVSAGETETVSAPPVAAEIKPVEMGKAEEKATVQPLPSGREPGKLDTATVSVFELFGLEKPSETEKVKTLSDLPPVSEESTGTAAVIEPPRSFMDSQPIIPDVTPEIPPRRRGLRAALRSRFTKVRVPGSD